MNWLGDLCEEREGGREREREGGRGKRRRGREEREGEGGEGGRGRVYMCTYMCMKNHIYKHYK